MAKIVSLDTKLINQIAAGEVIDRPASVIKELIENSLDAGADNIEINIIKGGHESIQVIDNGCGMSKNDLRMAFKRHATSKINKLEDLSSIKTLGFRGEALPSIASVSMFTVVTSISEGQGNQIKIRGSKEVFFKPAASLKGTSCTVKNLFYNTPARRKFLKKPETEQTVIYSLIRRFMFSYPNVKFILRSNNKITYDVHPHSLEERIIEIYGSLYKEKILKVELNKNPYLINGYIGNLSLVKKRQSEQYIFLNGRYIKNRLINSAINSSYKTLINRGEYPFFIISINMPYNYYDVNVHPGKLEVRFINEWQVYHVLKSAITKVLKNIINVLPSYDSYNNKYLKNEQNNQFNIYPNNTENLDNYEVAPHKTSIQNQQTILENSEESFTKAHSRLKIDSNINFTKTDNYNNNSDKIWQIHSKYLITEIKNGLIIVDQHVAHERVLYEEAKKALNGKGFPSQSVLFPQTLKLQPDEYDTLIELTHYLEKIGFRFREFGPNTIIIDGIPSDIKWGNEIYIINEIIDQFISIKNIDPSFIDQLAALYACKSAIKAGDILKPLERTHLLDKLFSTEHPYYCPHGRPIIINLSIEELDKRFERV